MSLTGSRRLAVAMTSTALMGLSALAIPGTAGAAEIDCDPADVTYAVTGGTIEWGFYKQFRDYFFDRAHGTLTPSDGASFSGENTAADGRIVWPVTGGAATSSDTVSATGAGSANFSAHGGVLNTTLSNPSIEIDGLEGILKLDYTGNAQSGGAVGKTQAEAARFTLPDASDFHSSVTITAPSTLAEEFEPVFGSYEAGTSVDPVTVNLTITQQCSTDPGEGGEPGDNNGNIPGDNNDGNTGSSAIQAFFKRILGFIGS